MADNKLTTVPAARTCHDENPCANLYAKPLLSLSLAPSLFGAYSKQLPFVFKVRHIRIKTGPNDLLGQNPCPVLSVRVAVVLQRSID